MKKLFSLLLAFALLLSGSVTALAAGTGDYTTDVTGTYVAGTTGNGTVFSVNIVWTSMSFTYHAANEPVWDVETHTYSEATPAYWEGAGTISITNHSNRRISATPAYTAEEGFEDVSMIFSGSVSVASAESGTALTGCISVQPDGELPADTNGEKIGTITVTIQQEVTLEDAQALKTKLNSLYSTVSESSRGLTPSDALYSEYSSLISQMDSTKTILDAVINSLENNSSYDGTDMYNDCCVEYQEELAAAKALGIV